MPSVAAAGLTFRLPTEEEWEFACRAGATGDFCRLADGDEISGETLGTAAWFEGNSNGRPQPAGRKKPNAFGLFDMLGNVWEWTSTESPMSPNPNLCFFLKNIFKVKKIK